jgi:hypothetical protein
VGGFDVEVAEGADGCDFVAGLGVDHGVTSAERVIKAAETVFVLDVEDWEDLPKGDWRQGLVAGLIRASALAPNGWVAKRLFMGAPGAVSRTIREARELVMEDRKVRSQQRKIEKMSIPSD